MEEHIIETDKYKVRFKGSKREKEYWEGSGYYESKHDGYWYEGTGIVDIKNTGDKHFFVFQTSLFEKYSFEKHSLEKSLVLYNGCDFVNEEARQNAVNLILGKMVEEIKSSKDDLEIVKLRELDYEDLINRGLIPDTNGQIHLAM